MTLTNQQIHLISRPTAEASAGSFALVQASVPELEDGQVLVRHHFMSLDPYMRGRMNDGKSYAVPQALHQVMGGGTAGEVVASRNAQFAEGDKVVGMGGWQQYSVVNAGQPGMLRKVSTAGVPLSAYLGVVGMPGVTAWYGLNKIITPQAGQTVLVSAASGAVGATVGQLAKAKGCRVVGIAGGAAKCKVVVEEFGFDVCIDHRTLADGKTFNAAVRDACPQGIDGVFENVGGLGLDAALMSANAFARVAVCGMISGYNGEPIPLRTPQLILTNRMLVQGFIVSEHMNVWPEALAELSQLVASGKMKYRESVAQGLESAPAAFIGLLAGKNFGKQLVKLI